MSTMEVGLATGASVGGGWAGLADVATSGAGSVPPAFAGMGGSAGSLVLVSSVWPVVAAGCLAGGGLSGCVIMFLGEYMCWCEWVTLGCGLQSIGKRLAREVARAYDAGLGVCAGV